MYTKEDLLKDPNPLAASYSRFRVSERMLLTGHSHQAWPDRAFEGQCRAWLDAAEHVDEKWGRAFEKADRVREGFARLLDDREGHIALAPNTHDLVVRFLSALPLRSRPRLVTTDGEFHSIRRQLDRLAEEGIEVVKVPAYPASSAAERLAARVDSGTAAVLVSSVLFLNAQIVPNLGSLMASCLKAGAELLVDTYHHLNAVPFSMQREGLENAYVVGGGYKYCQLGEGNCFLRIPARCALRPVITGWFSEFDALESKEEGRRVVYGPGPSLFAGSTYDPSSHYRAAEGFDIFSENGLSTELLREISRHQVGLLAECFDNLDADPKFITRDRSVPLERIGGFLTLDSQCAAAIYRSLKERSVLTDYRAEKLRLGPAPYLSDRQLRDAVAILGEVIEDISTKK
jgi:kynureninase